MGLLRLNQERRFLSLSLSIFRYLSLAGLRYNILTGALDRYFFSRLFCTQTIVLLPVFYSNRIVSLRCNDNYQYEAWPCVMVGDV